MSASAALQTALVERLRLAATAANEVAQRIAQLAETAGSNDPRTIERFCLPHNPIGMFESAAGFVSQADQLLQMLKGENF